MEPLQVLNCSGTSDEVVGQLMSNPASTPFVLDGVWFASVEAFYIVIRTANSDLHAEIRLLDGKKAKNRGSNLKRKFRPTRGCWLGIEFDLGSPHHHALVKRAIRQKLLQNPELLRDFLATAPRPIVHLTGWPESRFTQLTAAKFTQMLSELRDELTA